MGAVVVLDSSVLLSLWDPDDPRHAVAASAIRDLRVARARFVVPSLVLAEVLVGAARQGEGMIRLRLAQLRAAFGEPHPIDTKIGMAAARLRGAHGSIRTPDALVIAAAQVIGADEVLTTDRRWEQVEHRVRVLAG